MQRIRIAKTMMKMNSVMRVISGITRIEIVVKLMMTKMMRTGLTLTATREAVMRTRRLMMAIGAKDTRQRFTMMMWIRPTVTSTRSGISSRRKPWRLVDKSVEGIVLTTMLAIMIHG